MEVKNIESVQARMEADKDFIEELVAYNRMVNLQYDLPAGWQTKSWVRKQVSTDAHDAIKTANNIYDASNPKWEIQPRGQADRDRAEELETALEWFMQRANKAGEYEPFRKALHNSCLQNCVIYQMDYLPYWLPKDKSKWNKEQKAAIKASSHYLKVHDRINTFFEMGKNVVKWAASVSVMYAQDVIDNWSVYANDSTKDGKKVASAIEKIKKQLEENEEQKYVHVDFTSYDKREVSIFPTTLDNANDFLEYEPKKGDKHIDIMDCENKMGFVNWVIVTGDSTPMLYSMHKARLWENQNLFDTINHSTTMRRAVLPIIKHISPTGKELDIDYTGEQDVMELTREEQAEFLQPPPIDPAMSQLSGLNTSKLSQASGIKGLSNIEIAGNVQYAAVDAVIKLHMTNLQPYVRTFEKATSQAGDMAFRWLQEGDGYTEIAYRTKNKGNGKMKGDGIAVSPEDFDPDALYISCSLIANTLNDKMQTANYYATLIREGAHIGWKEVLEKLSEGNGDVLETDWIEEQALALAVKNKSEQLSAEIQMKMKEHDAQIQSQLQQQGQQQQMQAEQAKIAAEQQANAPTGNPMTPQGGGADTGMGGTSAAMSNPGANSPRP